MKINDIVRSRLTAAARQAINVLRIALACKHGETITINGRVYEISTRADLAITGDAVIDLSAVGTAASATLTLTANAGDGETVVLGSRTYTFKAALTGAANEVLIGDTPTASLLNLIAAITAGTGAGAAYGTGTLVHALITAVAGAHVAATGTLTSDNTNVADGETVTIGSTVYRFKDTPVAAYDVQIGADADTSLLNLIKAINASGTAGTHYFAGTLIHPTVSAAASVTSHAFAITAKTAGAAGNLIDSTETSGHLSFGAATLTGGTSVLTATALAKGTAGNALASTETLSTGSFGGSVLSGGVDPTATESSAGIVASINADTGNQVSATLISANEVLIVSERPGVVYACTETLSGANNVFASATMFGGAQEPANLPFSNIAKRSATATETTLQNMHFVFGHDVTAAIVQIRDSNGALKTWDGVVSYSGRRVTLASSGSSDIAATDEVSVLAS